MRNVAIIGSGPAGFTAAIYNGRARLEPVLYAGEQKGGQLMTTTDVENFPGFPEGIHGPKLMEHFQTQAARFGTDIREGVRVTKVSKQGHGFRVEWEDMYQGTQGHDEVKAVIVATGASAKHLGIPGEKDFFDGSGTAHGVTACATCDGAMPIYRNKPVAVVGGGDTACEEALFMTRFASQVYLIHRRDALRASRIMAERALKHPKITPVWNKGVTAYLRDAKQHVRGVAVQDTVTGATSELALNGVFLAIGHVPNTRFLKDSGVVLDAAGYIEVEKGCRTSVPGLFAAGDVRDTVYRQAITAAGMGCMAALEVERFLDGH